MLMRSALASIVLLLAACGLTAGQITIEITGLPPCEAPGNLEGIVTGPGSPGDYEVATYIHPEGSGWWVKPLDNDRTVPVNPDWTFSVPIYDVGLDVYATIYSVAVVGAGYWPPGASGSECLPRDPEFLATDCTERYCHTLPPFGIDRTTNEPCAWGIKHAPLWVGPGGNLFRPENAWLDAQGRLHLAITQEPSGWCSAEVMMTKALGYGEYLFQSSTGVDGQDSEAVFGGFTWDPYGDCSLDLGWRNREIDLAEDTLSDLLIPGPHDSQYVVQPWDLPGHRYTYDLDESEITRVMIWHEDRLEFYTVQGHHTLDTWQTAPVIESWTDYSDTIPQPGEARWRFNFWLLPPNVPAGDGSLEFIVDHFEYAPEPGVVCLLGVGAMMLARRRRQQL